jgi:hypothetical protein
MARITINDLPPGDGLSPEQEEQVLGAGPKSFRPSIEALEAREVYDASLGGALLPTPLTELAPANGSHVQPFTPEGDAQADQGGLAIVTPALAMGDAVLGPDLDAALWGGMAPSQEGMGDVAYSKTPDGGQFSQGPTLQTSPQTGGREWDEGGSHFKESFTPSGDRVLERSVGGTLQSRETTFANGVIIRGELKGGLWVETTTGSKAFQSTVEIYDKVDGTLLERTTRLNSGSITLGVRMNGQWFETTFTGKVEMQKDGTVKMFTPPTIPGAKADGDYKIYRRVGNEWKVIFYKHQIQDPTGSLGSALGRSGMCWMEESWAVDGSKYTQDIWAVEDHAGAAENDRRHLSKTVVEGGKAKTTFYHTRALTGGNIIYMWGSARHEAADAQVTYVHAVDAQGKLGEMLSFQLIPDGRVDWGNTWTKEKGWDTNDGGYPYGQGGRGRPVEPGVVYHQNLKIGYPVQLNPAAGAEAVRDLPFLTGQTQHSKDGRFRIETFWDKGRTQAVQFVYWVKGNELYEHTYGHMVNGEWVQETTRVKDLVTQLLDQLKAMDNDSTQGQSGTTDDGFWVQFHMSTPGSRQEGQAGYFGNFILEFKRGEKIDGVQKYEVKVKGFAVAWISKEGKQGSSNHGLDKLGVTEKDLQEVVDRWNERAVLR